MVRAKNDGPDLPPLTQDLRHTPADAIHNLFGAVFFQALQEQDGNGWKAPTTCWSPSLRGSTWI